MLEDIKMLLNIQDNSQDGLLSFYLGLMVDKVKNYCNINNIPMGLERVIVEMVVNLRKQIMLAESIGNIASVKRGDTTITYGSGGNDSNASILADNLIMGYRAQLNVYRKLRTIYDNTEKY